MPYYAPFYRPTYYDPVQQSQMGQYNPQYQQQMTQMMQNAQIPMQGQQTNDFLWVLNENISIHALLAESDKAALHPGAHPVISIHALLAESDL